LLDNYLDSIFDSSEKATIKAIDKPTAKFDCNILRTAWKTCGPLTWTTLNGLRTLWILL